MKYNEALNCLYQGMIIKSEQCMYIRVCDKIYWCWLGETCWTEGEETLKDSINTQEENENWSIVFNTFNWI